MASVSRKTCFQEGPHQFGGGILADNPPAQAEYVGVVMLHGLMSRVVVVGQYSPYPGQFVGGDRRSGARPAYDDAPLGFAGYHRFPYRGGVVRIVHRVGRVGSEIDEVMLMRQDPGEVVLQRVTRMVGTDSDSDGVLLTLKRIACADQVGGFGSSSPIGCGP